MERPGGYTRILRIEPMKEDQAESAILELVDGPKDLHFAMTAKTLSRLPARKLSYRQATHVKKATQFRKDGMETLQCMIQRMRLEQKEGFDDRLLAPPRKVYPEIKMRREMHYVEETEEWKLPNALPKKRRNPAQGKPLGRARKVQTAVEVSAPAEIEQNLVESEQKQSA